MKIIKIVVLAALFWATTPLSAVFFQAHEYSNPATGQTVWLFGDLHCDLDQYWTNSKLHQTALLKAAQNKRAFVIAENVKASWYSEALDITLALGIVASFWLVALKNKNYSLATVHSAILTGLVIQAYKEYCKQKLPDLSYNDFIQTLKKGSTNSMPFFQVTSSSVPFFQGTPLTSLVEQCKKNNIKAIDIEFRYHFIITLLYQKYKGLLGKLMFINGACIHYLSRFISGNQERYPVTITDYCDINNKIVEELEAHDQNVPVLKNFYDHCIKVYKESPITLFLYTYASPYEKLATIVPKIAHSLNKDEGITLNEFIEHNMPLLDARVIQQIYKNKNEPVLFVCVGALHAETIAPVLEKLGYQKKNFFGNSLKTLQEVGILNEKYWLSTNHLFIYNLDYLTLDLEKILA